MINWPTVFVVGAGASVDYDLPLGSVLVELIVDGLSTTGFLRKPLLEAGFRLGDLETFADRLKRSDLDSIDAFLEGNEVQFTEIGKAAIASAILFRERDSRGHLFTARRNDHWLRYLWGVMKSQADTASFADNKISFVTFNYDRLIEYYFETVLQTTFNLKRDDARELRDRTMQIVHLHGSIVGRDFGDYSHPLSGEVVQEIASGIRVVHDEIPRGDEVFQIAYELFKSAKRVCFLGFGYHPVNIVRLQLNSLLGNKAQLTGTAYGLGQAEVEMAKKRVGRDFITGGRDEKVERFLRERVPLE